MASVNLTFTGTVEECNAYVARQHECYPTPGYGTWFNWPPNSRKSAKGEPITYLAPTDHVDGRWTVRGDRSTSCD